MVYTTHWWWLGGWFIIAIPTLHICYMIICYMRWKQDFSTQAFLIQICRISLELWTVVGRPHVLLPSGFHLPLIFLFLFQSLSYRFWLWTPVQNVYRLVSIILNHSLYSEYDRSDFRSFRNFPSLPQLSWSFTGRPNLDVEVLRKPPLSLEWWRHKSSPGVRMAPRVSNGGRSIMPWWDKWDLVKEVCWQRHWLHQPPWGPESPERMERVDFGVNFCTKFSYFHMFAS